MEVKWTLVSRTDWQSVMLSENDRPRERFTSMQAFDAALIKPISPRTKIEKRRFIFMMEYWSVGVLECLTVGVLIKDGVSAEIVRV